MADNPAANEHESTPFPTDGGGNGDSSPASPTFSASSGLTPEQVLDSEQKSEKNDGHGSTNPGRDKTGYPPYGDMGGSHVSSFGHGYGQGPYFPSHGGQKGPSEKRRRTAAELEYGRLRQDQSQMYGGGGQYYSQQGAYHYHPESMPYSTQHSGMISHNQPGSYDTRGAINELSAQVDRLHHFVRESQNKTGITYSKLRKEVAILQTSYTEFGTKLDEIISQLGKTNSGDNPAPLKRPRSGSVNATRGAGGGAHSSGAKSARSGGTKHQTKGGKTRNFGDVLIPDVAGAAAPEGSSPEYATALDTRARALHNEAKTVVTTFMEHVKAKRSAFKCDTKIAFDAPASQYMENKHLVYPCKMQLVLPKGSTMKLWEHIQFCADIHERFAKSASKYGDFWVTDYFDKVTNFLADYKKLPCSAKAMEGLANKTKAHMAYFCALQFEDNRKQDPAAFRCSSCTAIIRRDVAFVCTRCCVTPFCKNCNSLSALRVAHESSCTGANNEFWEVDAEM